MRRLTDAEMVARCLDGNEDACAALVDAYKDLVFGVISQVISDRAAVEDLAQEVFLKVHKGLPTFRGDAKLSTWIYRIVRNVCADASKRLRQTNASLDERDEEGRLRREPAVADAAFEAMERRDRLEKAIACLSVEQRFLISAHYFAGQQYQELADIMDMPIGTVKTLLHRAKNRLRELMSEGGDS
jgi:RNA polymerase sigma-70 factor (ECF subfamily)